MSWPSAANSVPFSRLEAAVCLPALHIPFSCGCIFEALLVCSHETRSCKKKTAGTAWNSLRTGRVSIFRLLWKNLGTASFTIQTTFRRASFFPTTLPLWLSSPVSASFNIQTTHEFFLPATQRSFFPTTFPLWLSSPVSASFNIQTTHEVFYRPPRGAFSQLLCLCGFPSRFLRV